MAVDSTGRHRASAHRAAMASRASRTPPLGSPHSAPPPESVQAASRSGGSSGLVVPTIYFGSEDSNHQLVEIAEAFEFDWSGEDWTRIRKSLTELTPADDASTAGLSLNEIVDATASEIAVRLASK